MENNETKFKVLSYLALSLFILLGLLSYISMCWALIEYNNNYNPFLTIDTALIIIVSMGTFLALGIILLIQMIKESNK